jgi:hypothetical protein
MAALWPLAAGPLLGMLVVMLPFAFLDALVEWQRFDPEWRQPPGDRVRYLAARQPRHPRALARIPPTQLGLWSFTVAIAHGEWRTAIVSSCLGSGMRAARAGNKIATALVGASSHFIPWDRKTASFEF